MRHNVIWILASAILLTASAGQPDYGPGIRELHEPSNYAPRLERIICAHKLR